MIPQAFVHWEAVLPELMQRTAKFPKNARFTFAQRLENLGLDIIEDLVDARFCPRDERTAILQRIDRRLNRLRVLLRLANTQRLLDHRGYESLARSVDELGRMVGGWRKSLP